MKVNMLNETVELTLDEESESMLTGKSESMTFEGALAIDLPTNKEKEAFLYGIEVCSLIVNQLMIDQEYKLKEKLAEENSDEIEGDTCKASYGKINFAVEYDRKVTTSMG